MPRRPFLRLLHLLHLVYVAPAVGYLFTCMRPKSAPAAPSTLYPVLLHNQAGSGGEGARGGASPGR